MEEVVKILYYNLQESVFLFLNIFILVISKFTLHAPKVYFQANLAVQAGLGPVLKLFHCGGTGI